MTAVAFTQRTARFRAARFRTARALRLEIKRNAVVWVLPILAALRSGTITLAQIP